MMAKGIHEATISYFLKQCTSEIITLTMQEQRIYTCWRTLDHISYYSTCHEIRISLVKKGLDRGEIQVNYENTPPVNVNYDSK